MPIPVTCPGCETEYPVPENLAGKTIRCKKCGEQMPVPTSAPAAEKPKAKKAVVAVEDDEDDDTPSPPRRRPAGGPKDKAAPRAAVAAEEDDDADDDGPPRRSRGGPKGGSGKSKTPLIVGGIVGVLVLVGGGIAAAVMFGGDGDKGKEVAKGPQPGPNYGAGMSPPPATNREPDPNKTTTGTKAPNETKTNEPPAPVKGNTLPPAPPPAIQEKPPAATVPPTPQAPPPAVASGAKTVQDDLYTPGPMNPIVRNRVKQAGVLIKCETDIGVGNGSGWFGIEPGLIFTNAHVLFMKAPGSKEPKKITVYLNSGTNEQREIPHARLKILAVDREIDLALIQVVGEKDLPVPLNVRPSADLVEGQPLYTIGFPFGTRTSQGKKEPEVSVRPTSFTAQRRNDFGVVRRIQLEGGVYTGNSGGAVVDKSGACVGVVVEVAIDQLSGGQSQLGLAVPTDFVTGMLAGRIGEVEYQTAYKKDGKVHIPVKATCFDPLKRLTKVGMVGWVGDSSDKYRQPGTSKPSPFPSDSDYTEAELRIERQGDKGAVATGEIVLPELPPGRAFWAQPYYSNYTTPAYYMPGIRVPQSGPPVDRVPAELMYKVRAGAKRSVTMTNSNDLNEYVEGEGESKNERVFIKPVLKLTETMQGGRQGYAAVLNFQFDELNLMAQRGEVEQDIIPKPILKLIRDNIKSVSATGWMTPRGEMAKHQFNLLAVQDPLAASLVAVLGSSSMEALAACSIPMPNSRMDAGKSWDTTHSVRLTLTRADGPATPPKAGGKPGPNPRPGPSGKPGAQGPQGSQPAVREYKYQNVVTYTYVGQRERAGKKEAVVSITGKTMPAPGAKETATGELKGLALIELDTGVVLEADLENEFELDTSGDGEKKRLSAVNKYKLSRGSSAN